LRAALREALHIDEAGDRSGPIDPRVIHDEIVDGYRTERLFFFSAEDIVVTGVFVHPRGTGDEPRDTTMLLLKNGTHDIPAERYRLEALLRQGRNVFVYDVRGTGAVTPRNVNVYHTSYPIFATEYKLNCDAIMLGLNMAGLRVFDLLRGYDYLKTRADVGANDIHGIGPAATRAVFAAALEAGFAALTAEEMLRSYRELCTTRYYDHELFDLRTIPWGILQTGDISDFLPLMGNRPANFVRLRNALGEELQSM
jgi:hypothetical protein